MPTAIDYLSTYLQDHRAGAELGSDLAARLRDENLGTPYEDFLTRLAQQIEQDVATLEAIMERFDVDKSLLKTAGAKIGEKLGPPEAQRAPLRLLAAQPRAGARDAARRRPGQARDVGRALRDLRAATTASTARSLLGLIDRAESQLTGLREHHRMAAREAFAA